MINKIATVINSLKLNLEKRAVLGIQKSNSYLWLKALEDMIEYCDTKSEIMYQHYSDILEYKFNILANKCEDIFPIKTKELKTIVINNKTFNKPYEDIIIKISDLIDITSTNTDITKVDISSDDFLINNKDFISLNPSETITLEFKHYYIPKGDKYLKINKRAYDMLKGLGFSILKEVDNYIVMYKEDKRYKIPYEEVSLIANKLYITLLGNMRELSFISNTTEIVINSVINNTNTSNDSNSLDEIFEVDLDKSKEIEHIKNENIDFRPKYLPIDNLYKITDISKFLEYNYKEETISLSKRYKYFTKENSIIAIPKFAYNYLEVGYLVSEFKGTSITFKNIETDTTLEFPAYDITQSLYMCYNTKEKGKLISNISKIIFNFDIENKEETSIDKIIVI